MELNQEQIRDIETALAEGQKIKAIKHYRNATGYGLSESKEFIDALATQLFAQDPEKYARLNPSAQAIQITGPKFLLVVVAAGLLIAAALFATRLR